MGSFVSHSEVLIEACGRVANRMITVRRGDTQRAKLYFLRDRVGKSRRLRDRRRGLKHV